MAIRWPGDADDGLEDPDVDQVLEGAAEAMTGIVYHQARLQCTADRAFALFSDNALLESWLCDRADVEPRLGGKYELFWDPGAIANRGTTGCKVTALAPGRLLAFDWRGPTQFDGFMNSADPLTHVVVSFAHAGELETDVHLVHSGWGSTPEWEEARAWFDQAWGGALKVLEQRA